MSQATQTTSESSVAQRAGDHVLLTVLGTSPRETRYALGSKTSSARLAPVALLDLLPDSEQPSHILALCTPEAERESWTLLKDALSDRYQTTLVAIPANVSPEEQVNVYLEKFVEVVPRDAGITMDVTHGFRHFSFLTYIAVLYLAALRGIEVRGAYYGLLNRDGSSPFLDLRPLLKLPGWIHALQVMDETGSTLPMAKALKDGLQGKSVQQAERIERYLTELSQGYLSGLPIELGRQARMIREQCLNPLRKLLTKDHRLPLGQELVDRFDDILKPLALGPAPAQGEGWKKHIVLSKCELQRQAGLIDDLLRRGSVATALGLLSEWTVSWIIWRMGYTEQWLDYSKVRRRAANLLGAVRAISVGDHSDLKANLTPDLHELGVYWQALSNLRNGYAHHGMRPQPLLNQDKSKSEMQKVLQYWQTLRQCPRFPLSLGEGHSRILVSPIGMRPGVLFSALQVCRTERGCGEPARCLVICSRETEGKIAETLEKAAYRGDVELLCLENPYGGSDEVKRLERASRQHFIGASEVVVNVTGGTTLMGLVAEALASTARGLACPVRRFGLIDRRAPHEQDADPYRVGEKFWLDRPMHSDDADEH